MLKLSTLQNEIQSAIEEIFPGALEEAYRATLPRKSKKGDTAAKRFGEVFTKQASKPLAQMLAQAIDYHVRSISISGWLLTYGSPGTHTCTINSPSPITNGVVPNSLKIN